MIADPSMPSYLITFCSTARPEKRMSCHVPVPAFCEPGACSSSCDICRPLTGSSCTSRSLTLAPMRAELRSMAVALRRHRHRLGDAGRLQLEIEAELLARRQRHVGVFERREAAERRADGVDRRLQVRDDVAALRVDVTVRSSPVLWFLTVTVAPGTNAPV